MKRFRFRLSTVLGWRALQLELEQGKLETLLAERRRIDDALALTARRRREADALLSQQSVEARDLAALGEHRQFLARETQRIAHEAAGCERRIQEQRLLVLEAERRVRLLERLKERRLAEWQFEADRELEAFASEAFLAKWVREH